MLGDFPLTGAGFGTFAEVFPRYQPPGAVARWTHAHNDYLELLLDGGAIAGGLVLWLSLAYGWRLVRRLHGGGWSPVRVGLALGVVSLAIHAAGRFQSPGPGQRAAVRGDCGARVRRGAREPAVIRRIPFIVLALMLVVGYGVFAYHGAIATLGMERASPADDDEEWMVAPSRRSRTPPAGPSAPGACARRPSAISISGKSRSISGAHCRRSAGARRGADGVPRLPLRRPGLASPVGRDE